jgi:hypothetical protein
MNENTYGVFLHSSGELGGYVVRTIYKGWTPAPYSSRTAVRTFKRESAAQTYADKLNKP